MMVEESYRLQNHLEVKKLVVVKVTMPCCLLYSAESWKGFFSAVTLTGKKCIGSIIPMVLLLQICVAFKVQPIQKEDRETSCFLLPYVKGKQEICLCCQCTCL